METNYDKSFKNNAVGFKKKFGIDHNSNPELYLKYLDSIFKHAEIEIMNSGHSKIIIKLENIEKALLKK